MGEARIAALYVETGGCYFGLPDVDPWDEARDARTYLGPHPVVCHSPCQRWGKFWAGQPLHIKRTGERKRKGADEGCFKAALFDVRRWGGVLEHPWDSHAWKAHDLIVPQRQGGWVIADRHGGWTCCVEQGRYGHYARKPTLLYAFGTARPELDWGIGEPRLDPVVVQRMGLARAKRLGEVGAKGGGKDSAPRIGTPIPFRDLLLSIARTATRERIAALPPAPPWTRSKVVGDLLELAACPFEPCGNDRRAPAVEQLAAQLAWERGGQTHPLSDYDLDRAEEIVTGERNLRAENRRLKARVRELEARTPSAVLQHGGGGNTSTA